MEKTNVGAHTQGEWKINKKDFDLFIMGKQNKKGLASEFVIAEIGGGGGNIEDEANAELIIKAPKMREKLLDIRQWLCSADKRKTYQIIQEIDSLINNQ